MRLTRSLLPCACYHMLYLLPGASSFGLSLGCWTPAHPHPSLSSLQGSLSQLLTQGGEVRRGNSFWQQRQRQQQQQQSGTWLGSTDHSNSITSRREGRQKHKGSKMSSADTSKNNFYHTREDTGGAVHDEKSMLGVYFGNNVQEGLMTAAYSGSVWGRGGVGSWAKGRVGIASSWAADTKAGQTCSRLMGSIEAAKGAAAAAAATAIADIKMIKASPENSISTSNNAGGGGGKGGSGGEGEGGGGGQPGKNGGTSGRNFVSNGNSTDPIVPWGQDTSFSLESGVDVNETLLRRSPLVRTLAPIFMFFKSRAGVYGMMLGYVVSTLSQHITPIYLGISSLAIIGPQPARRVVVLGAKSLSLLTVASYIQDQFKHQVYPLPAVVAGPSAPYAVVTGGSSGIGREIANELAGKGYNLLLVSRGKEGLRKAAKEIKHASREAAEAARKQHQAGESGQECSESETRRERKKRLKEQRAERRRRLERLSVDEKERSQPGEGRPFNVSSSLSSPFEGWSDQEGGDRNGVSPYSQAFNAITTRWFSADLANATAVQAVHDEVRRLNITVDILVNAAGVCRAGRVDDTDAEGLREQLELNVVGTSLLSRLFAKDFAVRKKGRIMILSSITAAAPNPRVAAYAASKSYLTSFAEALHSEVRMSGVGVTCVMPGATKTHFRGNSGASGALVWKIPIFCMEADEVAAQGVEALMRGDRIIVPGWQNKIFVHILAPLLPRKVAMNFVEAMWR